MVVIKQRFDPDDHYNGTNKIQFIVIHDTGNVTDSDEGNANYFCTGTRNASAHYFVDDDSITQVVRDTDGAFHCGDGHGQYGITNNNSLSIEMCRVNGVVTAKTEANCLDLVRIKMALYKVPLIKIVRHYDASRKNCPSSFNLDNKWTRWINFKAKIGKVVVAKTTVPSVKTAVVTASSLNIRSGAGAGFPVVGTLKQGDVVKIANLQNGFYFCDHGGYISAQYVK